jgi:hypothetical protein
MNLVTLGWRMGEKASMFYTNTAIGPWKCGQAGEYHLIYLRHLAYKGHVGSTEGGRVDIRNEALSNARMAFVNQDPGRIIVLIWGQASVLK